jgi:hypothetical protein
MAIHLLGDQSWEVYWQCQFFPNPPGGCTIDFLPSVLTLNDFDSLGTTVDQGLLTTINSPGILAPNITTGTQTFTFPFTVTGIIGTATPVSGIFPPCDFPTPDFVAGVSCSENVTGHGIGTVTVRILYQPGLGGGLYYTQDVRFDFVAAPEPSTIIPLLLLLLVSFQACRRYRNGCW